MVVKIRSFKIQQKDFCHNYKFMNLKFDKHLLLVQNMATLLF
jgi:hypothetical protein